MAVKKELKIWQKLMIKELEVQTAVAVAAVALKATPQ